MEENNENEYFCDECIIQDANFLAFNSLMKCHICNKILKNPMMCVNCQGIFCKKCIEKWQEKNEKCPNNCNQPNYAQNKDKIALLSMIKYKCKNCKEIVNYYDVDYHLGLKCGNAKENRLVDIIYKKRKLNRLTDDEVKQIKESKIPINYLTSKSIYFYYFLSNSHNIGSCKCWKIFLN